MGRPHRNQLPARRKRRRGPGLAASLLVLSLGAVAGLGVGAALGQWSAPPAAIAGVPSAGTPTVSPDAGFHLLPRLDTPLNVLFMACDDTDSELRHGERVVGLTGNTDTMILLRLDPPHARIRMLSIPRDTRVAIPGHGTFKVNAAVPYGGPELARQTVAGFLGVPIDRYVLINTRAVIQLVDALGGVRLFVPKDLNYDDRAGHLHIHLAKGQNFLDGQKAHDYLRFRHDDLGDIGRVQRQQAFLQAFLTQYLTPANLLQTPRLLGLVKANMATDLGSAELLKLVGWGKDLKRDDVTLAMVPGREAVIRGGWYWDPDPAGTRAIVAGFLEGQLPEAARSPGVYHVAVADASGDRRAVRRAIGVLERAGYRGVEFVGPAPERVQAETQVIAQRADEAGARALASALGLGRVVVAATGSLGSDFTVVLGTDWLRAVDASPPPSAWVGTTPPSGR